MFVLYKKGIYGHGVHGLFETQDAAEKAAEVAASALDKYHTWQVYEIRVDVWPLPSPHIDGYMEDTTAIVFSIDGSRS